MTYALEISSELSERRPSDLLLISSTGPDGMICFVETMNLDGETNLKVRQSLEGTWEIDSKEESKLQTFKTELLCEPSNASLYTFSGRLTDFAGTNLLLTTEPNPCYPPFQSSFQRTGTDMRARVKSAGLNEELGQVDTIFSDNLTGTLTCNQIDFSRCTIQPGVSYGEASTEVEMASQKSLARMISPKETDDTGVENNPYEEIEGLQFLR